MLFIFCAFMFEILMVCVHEVDSCVRGYHVYQYTWTPLVGEELHCEREENIHDHYAVVVKKGVLGLATCQEKFLQRAHCSCVREGH